MDALPSASPPFVHFIRVGWGGLRSRADRFHRAAGGFALEAIDAWWEHVVGADWYRMNIDRGVGTPFVHMTMDFRKPVTPRHRLACEVALLRLGASSVRLGVRGRQDGKLCFEGEFVQALLRAPDFVKFKIPEDVLAKLRSAVVADELPSEDGDEAGRDGRRHERDHQLPRRHRFRRLEPGARDVDAFIATVGERVRKARQRKGIARRVLSELSGVSQRYLAQLENGDGNISIGLLYKIAQALDHRIEWLVGADDPWGSETAEFAELYRSASSGLRQKVMDILIAAQPAQLRRQRIGLIGLRGAGKSTLGRRLGAALRSRSWSSTATSRNRAACRSPT